MKTAAALLLMLATLALPARGEALPRRWLIVSIADQELVLLENGMPVKRYPVSTSKFGVGDRPGSYRTPLGAMVVADKIGAGAQVGTVFKGRQRTREVIRPNAPGRDPVVTRILWLRGLSARNSNALDRAIYIHGTPEERRIGRPASFGCIRMRSRDIVDLFDEVEVGTRINVVTLSLRQAMQKLAAEIKAASGEI